MTKKTFYTCVSYSLDAVVARETKIFDSDSINGAIDMTLFEVVSSLIKQKPALCSKQDKRNNATPLHDAYKAGNLELAIWIIKLAKSPIVDLLDNDGMRAIDLLAFKVDDDHKQFIKESPLFEKNYKIKKVFEAYSWGRSDDFLLGYPTLKEEQT